MKETIKRFLIAYVRVVNDFWDAVSFRRSSKRVEIFAACLTLALAAFITVEWNLFLNPATDFWGWKVMGIAYAFALLIGLLLVFRIEIEERFRNKFYTVIFFLMPVVSMQMVECYNGNFLYVFSPANFFMNYMAYLLFYVVVFFITSRFRMTIGIVNVVLFLFGMANYFVDLFRGTPLVPMDILAVGTGMNVAAGYDYKLSWQIIMAALMLILIFVLERQMVNIRPQVRRSKIMVRATALAYILIIASTVYGTDVLADHGFKPDFWNQSRGYHNSGIWYNFCLNTKYLHVSEPEGYSADDISAFADEVIAAVDPDPDNDTSINMLTGEDTYKPTGETPNVIAIMNETFSDPGTLGDLQTNMDYLPFYHSLSENTIKGTLSVPVLAPERATPNMNSSPAIPSAPCRAAAASTNLTSTARSHRSFRRWKARAIRPAPSIRILLMAGTVRLSTTTWALTISFPWKTSSIQPSSLSIRRTTTRMRSSKRWKRSIRKRITCCCAVLSAIPTIMKSSRKCTNSAIHRSHFSRSTLPCRTTVATIACI